MDVRVCGGRGSLRLILGIVALALALVLAGCAAHSARQTGSSPHTGTKTESFHAYDASGQLVVKVADVASGNCWTNSVAAPAPDSYRCFAGNNILDPCFAPSVTTAPAEVACLASPWSAARVLKLTGPLPVADPAAVVRPWAFQLDNGARCVASTGTVPAVHGINLAYHCTDGRNASLRDTSADTVTADYGDVKAQTIQLVTVTRIWRG